MQIAQVLAGYSLGAADILRHAMGKKKPEEMAKQRKIFIKGSTSRGLKADLANQIFDLMEKFSGYGFNKSHSAAYALIAYQTAWLKALYPAEFMAAVLSSDMNNTDKVVGFINECRNMGLELLPPSINRGQYFFTVNVKGQIEYGLGAIKGVGESAVLNIVLCREEAGEFKGLFDLCHRVDFRKVNRRVLEPLIRSGAMDVFGVPRSSLMKSLDKALQSAEQKNRNTQLGQNDLFDNELDAKQEEYYEDTLEWNDNERLRGEKKTLGLYVTGHPLQACEKEMKTIGAVPISQLVALKKNTIVMIAGMVLAIRNLITRSGKRMAILTLEDCSGVIEVTVFSELYQQVAEDLNKDTILIVRGSVGKDDFMGGLKIVANLIYTLDKMREQAKRLLIRITAKEEVDQLLIKLPLLVKSNLKGKCPITIIYQGETASAELILGETWKVKPSEKLLSQLSQLCGKDKVELEYLKTSI